MTKTLKRNVVHTLPMPRAAEQSLIAWMSAHDAELAEVLAPHGISTMQALMPRFRVRCDGCDK